MKAEARGLAFASASQARSSHDELSSAGAQDYTPVEDTSMRVCFKRESRGLKKELNNVD